jgi:hypothetical protein
MSKVKPTTKEQLIHYLLSNVSLGTYDRKFLTNLETGFLGKDRPVTSNQAELLSKIVSRYARQLAKQEIDYAELINLPWVTTPVKSLPEYVTAYAELSNGKIIIRTPYKTTFIKELRSFRTAVWVKETKEWHINYNEANLKKIVTLIADHYELINFCEVIKDMMSIAESYENIKIWEPTLVSTGNNLIIAGITESMYDAILDLELETTPKCFSTLASYGVAICPTLMHNEILAFAADPAPKIERSNILELITYLSEIGCENVVCIATVHSMATDQFRLLTKGLNDKGINIVNNGSVDYKTLSNYVVLYSLAHAMASGIEAHATKLIQIVNSNPIKIQ